MLKVTPWHDSVAEMVYRQYPLVGGISYVSVTNWNGRLVLHIRTLAGEIVEYSNQRFARRCLTIALRKLKQVQGFNGRFVSFVLLDVKRGSVQYQAGHMWTDVRDLAHPEQMLIKADYPDYKATKAAFLAARPELSDWMLLQACRLKEASQHRFMTRLLYVHPCGRRDTPAEALENAREHEKTYV